MLIAACADPAGSDGNRADGGNIADGGNNNTTIDGRVAGDTDICGECSGDQDCREGLACHTPTVGGGYCLPVCSYALSTCPRGFDCVEDPGSARFLCVAPPGGCCVDEDVDGYGVGVDCLGADCNDEASDIHPGQSETCDGTDQNCNGQPDDNAVDCATPACEAVPGGGFEESTAGVCVNAACTPGVVTSCGQYSCDEGGESGDVCATTCAPVGTDRDELCVASAHCENGVCELDQANGETCDEDSDCQSGHCDSGVCCESGACCTVDNDCPGWPGTGTVCEDTAACQGSRGVVSCQGFQCTTQNGVPDDSACDANVAASDCGLYPTIYCTGEADQAPPSCAGNCATDADCDPSAHCDVNVCIPDLVDGSLCDEPSDCVSGHCTGNICCASGDCCVTPQDCPSGYASAPTCDDPTSCQGTRDAATCVAFVCGTQIGTSDDSACDAFTEASACGLYLSQFCDGSSDQVAPNCAAACSADSECDAWAHCDGSACLPDQPDGTSCDEASDCMSGHCQNGFCCVSGDCCAIATDCAPGVYSQPPSCLDSSTCQGTRVDPQCTTSSQCQFGPTVDDDSGCSGVTSNDCELFPAVQCDGSQDQLPDQASLCATSCAGDPDCDSGAYCNLGTGLCVSLGGQGDACTTTSQCDGTLQCVDGVCCTSQCTGLCQACNVADSLGTCAPVPPGTDPAGECGGLSCSAYFHSWSGDSCYQRSDAPDSAVSCNGNGACEGAADICPAQPRGPVVVTCNSLCQDPTGGTCTGTVAPYCSNVTPSPATTTCGTGACQRTVARCIGSVPNVCVPGTPSIETCNGIDDDCDGSADEGLATDGYEPNNSCSAYRQLGTLYSVSGPGQSTTQTITPTLYGVGDVDVFRVNFVENDSTCGCSFPSTDEDYAVTATLTVPTGVGSYDICLSQGTCNTGNCLTVVAGNSGSVRVWKDGCCGIGCDDTGTWYATVRGAGAPGYGCQPYTLQFYTTQGCR